MKRTVWTSAFIILCGALLVAQAPQAQAPGGRSLVKCLALNIRVTCTQGRVR